MVLVFVTGLWLRLLSRPRHNLSILELNKYERDLPLPRDAATACESCDKLRVLHVLLLLRRPDQRDLIGPRLGFTNSFSDRDGFLLCLLETINTLLGQDWFSSLVPIWDEDSPFTASRKAYKICIPKNPKKPMCQQNPTNLKFQSISSRVCR